jgi:uncharacterized protein (DUF1800 family)
MNDHQRKIQHLYLRAGFSETPKRIQELSGKTIQEIVDDLVENSKSYKDINYLPYPLNEREEKKGAGGIKLANLFIKSFSEMEQLNEQWIFKMTYTKAVLREKLVFFWHNHFSTSVTFSYLMQQQNNTIRKHALGKFGDLLHAIAKDPAMIIYLNNQQNVKDHPNENFAREVMELFTLGEGNYSEDDIKEAARAFTGWAVSKTGEFEFNPKKHDEGEKSFMGEKGFFTGEDILNKLLANKQTAVYLVSKIYKEFVNSKLNETHVNLLADSFYNSGYDIEKLMYSIFSSDWFYAEENIGVKIVSPVELIVRFKKILSIEFKELKFLINYQKALGQVLFFPPNVAGWKGHQAWIDSASLLLRLNTISYIHEDGLSLDVNGKPAFETENEDKRESNKKKKLTAKWDDLLEHFEGKSDDVFIDAFIQCETAHIDKTLFNGLSVKQKLIVVMTLPEFQLI